MRKHLVGILAWLCAGILTASAVQAWPEGHSFILFDGDGFETECIDVRLSGEVVKLYWAKKGTGLVLEQNPLDAARSSMSFVLPNHAFGDLYTAMNTYVDCACSRRGQPRYQVAGFGAGSGTCSCSVTYRSLNMSGTTRTEPLMGVELGDGAGCDNAYAKPVLRPRLQDRWNQDNPTR